MKFDIVLALTLMMALGSLAEKSKGRKSFILPSNSKLRQINMEQLLQNQNNYENDDDDSSEGNIESQPMDGVPPAVALKPDSSSGRLFFKKFFLLGKQTPPPQFIIITQPAANPTTSDPSSFSVDITGNVTTSPVTGRGEDVSGDYITGEDDKYEDEIANEKLSNVKKEHPITYKLIKGKGNQQGLSFVVPSKYMRNFKNKRNSVVVNPSATYNSGSNKVKKFLLSNNANGNIIKKKRSRSPVRRFIVSQN